MTTPIEVAQQMVDAWLAQDWQAVTELFAADGVMEIIPIRAKYQGHEAIRGHLDEVAGGIESLKFDTKVLLASGNTVTFERNDVFVYNGKDASVPCVGIMEIADGKVQAWREYFDGMTMGRAMGMV